MILQIKTIKLVNLQLTCITSLTILTCGDILCLHCQRHKMTFELRERLTLLFTGRTSDSKRVIKNVTQCILHSYKSG